MAGRSSGTGDPELTQAQLAALKAQTGLTEAEIQSRYAQIAQGQQELALKAQGLDIQRGQLGVQKGQLDLGGKELTSKDQLGRLGAAITLLDTMQKTNIASQANETNVLADQAKVPGVPAETVARAYALGGHPELANALAADKAAKRDALIRQMVPSILSAKNDTQREKTIKPGMEAVFPGSYNDALALAYPKPGNEFKGSKPETFNAPTTTGTTPTTADTGLGALASKLLTQTGLPTDTTTTQPQFSGNGYPILPNTPEVNYAGTGRGSLEGSTRTDLASGLTQLGTPSGGTIRFNTPQTETGNTLLANLITPQSATPVAQTGANIPPPPGVGQLVAPPPLNLGALLNNNPIPGVLPAAVPGLTPATAPTPTANYNIRSGFSPEALAAFSKYINIPFTPKKYQPDQTF